MKFVKSAIHFVWPLCCVLFPGPKSRSIFVFPIQFFDHFFRFRSNFPIHLSDPIFRPASRPATQPVIMTTHIWCLGDQPPSHPPPPLPGWNSLAHPSHPSPYTSASRGNPSCKYDALHIMTVVGQALKLISLLDRLADNNHIGTMLQKAKAEQST